MTDPSHSSRTHVAVPPGVHPLRAALNWARADAKRRGINDAELARRLDWKKPRVSAYLNDRLPGYDALAAMERAWQLPRPQGRLLRIAKYVEDPPIDDWEKRTLARTDISPEAARMLVAMSRESANAWADEHPELIIVTARTANGSSLHSARDTTRASG